MKLILCEECHDVVALKVGRMRQCACGKSMGRYTDDINAEVIGPCVVLGFANPSLIRAIMEQKTYGDLDSQKGRRFEAFIIPDKAPSVTRRE